MCMEESSDVSIQQRDRRREREGAGGAVASHFCTMQGKNQFTIHQNMSGVHFFEKQLQKNGGRK